MATKVPHLIFASILTAFGAAAHSQVTAIRAQRILTVSGSAIQNGVIIIRGGKIQSVGPGLSVPAGATVLTAHTVMPGLIDAHSYFGVHQELAEPADSITPELRAVDAFDPTDPAIARAFRAGITTAAIMPPNSNVIGGQAAVVRLGQPSTVLREFAGLKISISPESATPQRNPTSRAGIADLLARSLGAAARGLPSSGTSQTRLLSGGIPASLSNRVPPVATLSRGDKTVFVHAPGLADSELALQVIKHRPEARAAIVHPVDAIPLTTTLRSSGASVILGPLRFSDNERTLTQAGKLARAGVTVAFCTDAPTSDPGSLRMTAHLAVKYGMSSGDAYRAMTINAARLLGIGSRVGTITAGKDADLVLLSGDPLDLTSRVLAVISGGRIVHRMQR